jgi:hypothetical protein
VPVPQRCRADIPPSTSAVRIGPWAKPTASLTFVESATSASAIHAQLSVGHFAKVVAPTVGGFAADLALQTVPIDPVAAGCAQHLMLTTGAARARRDLGIGDPGHVPAPNTTRFEPYR